MEGKETKVAKEAASRQSPQGNDYRLDFESALHN